MTDRDAASSAERCPHCGAVAEVEPAGSLRQRCRVCGGPRVPVDDPAVARSGNEASLLVSARKERLRMLAWWLGGGLVGGLGAISLLAVSGVLLLAKPAIAVTLLTLIVAAVPVGLGAYAFGRGRRHQRQLTEQLDRAWRLVAADVVNAQAGDVSAARLAKVMRLSEPEAEHLLAELSVDRLLGERGAEAPRFRVPDPTVDPTLGLEDEPAATAVPETERREQD